MAKTTWKVITCYDGKEDAKDILVDLIAEKIRRNHKKDVESKNNKRYNQCVSYENDLPGLAG